MRIGTGMVDQNLPEPPGPARSSKSGGQLLSARLAFDEPIETSSFQWIYTFYTINAYNAISLLSLINHHKSVI